MTSEQALQRVESLYKRNPVALLLAQLLSLAALAEPVLIRKMRLEFLPNSNAADEADLWFSSLVQSRSPDGLVFYPEVSEILRRGLPLNLRDDAWKRTRQTHAGMARAIQIEEELTYLALDPQANQKRIDDLLGDAISAMVGGRNELANWAGRALPRLPLTVQTRETATALRIAADFRLGRNPDLRGALAPFSRLPAWVELLLPRLRRVRVGVNLSNRELTLGPVVSDPKSLPHSIEVPDTPTIPVEVRWTAKDGTPSSKILFVEKDGMSQPEPVNGVPIELITLANETWTLKPSRKQGGSVQLAPPAIAGYTDGYVVTLHWRTHKPIPGCLGFAVMRRRKTESASSPETEEILTSYLGFGSSAERELSTRQPVQRFSWIDRPPLRESEYSYRVVPVVGNPNELLMSEALASTWTSWIHVGVQVDAPISVTFNRTLENAESLGLTPEAFHNLSRADLLRMISTSGNPVRTALGGDLHSALTTLLIQARQWSSHVYVAMFELNDPEILRLLVELGSHANVVLSNGTATTWEHDINRITRAALHKSSVKVWDRILPPARLAHNKFMVVCDADERPRAVWTGNVNWTPVAFCLQANAAVVVNSPQMAEAYLDYWKQLAESGNRILKSGRSYSAFDLDDATVQPWLTPAPNLADLNAAERFIRSATQGILFLLNEPGERESLLRSILDQQNIFLLGVTRPGPTVRLYRNKDTRTVKSKLALPAPVQAGLRSRMIIIDPLGSHPVVMIGSHNFGLRGSKDNEENFLIIENDREVARRCATQIEAYYEHHSFEESVTTGSKPLLQSDDSWQRRYFEPDAQLEMSFWLGEKARTFAPAPESDRATATRKAAKPAVTPKTSKKAPAKRAAKK